MNNDIYIATEGPCSHKDLTGTLHLCTVSKTREQNAPFKENTDDYQKLPTLLL